MMEDISEEETIFVEIYAKSNHQRSSAAMELVGGTAERCSRYQDVCVTGHDL